MIKLQAKRFEVNFLLKLSDLKSNFMLTLGYLNTDLNNLGLVIIHNDCVDVGAFEDVSMPNYINSSLYLARKYAQIFVRGQYSRAKLEENFEL